MEKQKRERKVFVPIQVVRETKERFDTIREGKTADAFLNEMLDQK